MGCFLGFNCCIVGALGKAVGWRRWGKGKLSDQWRSGGLGVKVCGCKHTGLHVFNHS